MNAPEMALLNELRREWGDAYSVTVEDGKWLAHPSYGPVREPLEATSGRELQRLLRHKTEPHRAPVSDNRMST